jgi:hypothetical protein
MWLTSLVVAETDKVANFLYVDREHARQWNEHRHADEMRLMTGWCWFAKKTGQHRHGFKSKTVAYIDAHHELIQRQAAPAPKKRVRLRLVA